MITTRGDNHFKFQTSMPEMFDGPQQQAGDSSDSAMTTNLSASQANIYGSYISQSHHHHVSTSTSASESAESSPTTTLSLADDSSMTEMSPGSSPESPMAKPSSQRPHTADDLATAPHQPSPFFEMNTRSFAPGKRARNLKNLAVNTTGNVGSPRGAATSLPLAASKLDSADTLAPLETANTAFKRPASPPKRRPSNLSLTIVTPAANAGITPAASNVVPPTPSFSRPNTLRHFQSSPSLPLSSKYQSSNSAPALTIAPSRPTLERSSSEMQTRSDDDFNFDLPQSREEKPEAYPDGPICVFDPYVDLYLEPTAEQASTYDVILNVASEVRNPFMKYSTPDPTKEGIRLDGGGGIQFAPKRARTSSSSSNASTSKIPEGLSTPTTPKATPDKNTFYMDVTGGEKKPEYIHIPWEHNTDIVSDLLRLVKLIDDRVRLGKRVLIHCQCGVSRSATLVVAYCMYIHPEYSVQQAYDTVKKRSKWIGPNMNLIMQLQEFSSLLAGPSRRTAGHVGLRSLTPIEASAAWSEWRRSTVLSAPNDAQGPKTAPLNPPSGVSWPSRDDSGSSTPVDRHDGRTLSVPGAAAELNSSADPTLSRRRSSEKKRPQSLRFETTAVSTIPETVISTIPESNIPPVPEVPASTLLNAPSLNVDSLLDPLLSPRATTFTLNPFSADAPVARRPSAVMQMANEDPRSPAQQGTNPIVRNIADAL
ncbi:hypothetical protein ANO11243_083000 [Dothideomycetidae sp. 11243]|nr:hypothetical protein ANO11243_083000 [fungal sp. No.11243]